MIVIICRINITTITGKLKSITIYAMSLKNHSANRVITGTVNGEYANPNLVKFATPLTIPAKM